MSEMEGKGRGGVTAPEGFQASGVACGIKESGQPDLAMLYSEVPASAAAVFTTNLFRAAPLRVTESHLEDGTLRAVVVNSGNANACTGEKGMRHALCMGAETAKAISSFKGHHLASRDVAVASTGVIGVKMPMDNVAEGIRRAAAELRPQGNEDAARAILTTDTFPKQVRLDCGGFVIGGMAKGAGMIRPDMATMLAFLTTDASLDVEGLRPLLKQAVDRTFNLISVDGCTSTNDMVLLMANGTSGVRPQPDEFGESLTRACAELARMIVRDGEGATRFVEIRVHGAPDARAARQAARAVADSALLKSAFYGGDPNWGRVAGALGSCGVIFDPGAVSISIDGVPMLERGAPAWLTRGRVEPPQLGKEIVVDIDLGMGRSEAVAWTCDLTPEYVRINSHYTT
jgi:glutamate N-acetyltransferase/amino-acid N-acetyltransferase